MNYAINFPDAVLYVDYTQGSEDSVTLSFQVSGDAQTYYDLLLGDNSGATTISLVGTQKKAYWIKTPISARWLQINKDYVNLQKTGTYSFSADGTTTSFSATLSTVVDAGSVSVSYTIGGTAYTGTDDGSGNISGTDLTGTIDYNTGALSLTFSVAPDAATTVDVSYTYQNPGAVHITVRAGGY